MVKTKIGIALLLPLALYGCDCGGDTKEDAGSKKDAAKADTAMPDGATFDTAVASDVVTADTAPGPDIVIADTAMPDSTSDDVISDDGAVADAAAPDILVAADVVGVDLEGVDAAMPDAMPEDTSMHRPLIAFWDFEDDNDIVDQGNANNTTNTFTTNGLNPGFVSGYEGGSAATCNTMNVMGESYVEFEVNASGHEGVVFTYTARTSNTASKYWQVQVSINHGAFAAVGDVVEHSGSTWSAGNAYDISMADGQPSVRIRLVASDSNGDGSGEFIQADGSGDPAPTGTYRFDNITFGGWETGLSHDAGPVDSSMPDTTPTEDAATGEDSGPMEDAGTVVEDAAPEDAASEDSSTEDA